jgi:predicted PurR-regulated permease PerM
MVITVRDVLVLIGLALFLAIGLEPAVSVLARHKFPRWSAVIIVLVASLGVVGGFLAAAIPPLARQTTQFVTQAPAMFSRLQSHNSMLGQLNDACTCSRLSAGTPQGWSTGCSGLARWCSARWPAA